MRSLLLLTLTVLLSACTETVGQAQEREAATPQAPRPEPEYVQEIAGYDVSRFKIEKAGLEVPYQRLTKHHLICLAASECDTALLRQLLADGAKPDMICDEDHPLTEIAFCKELALPMATLLLDYGGDVNGTDGSAEPALHYAAGQDDLALVKLLIERGAATDRRDENKLTGCPLGTQIRSVAMLQYLMARGVAVDARCNNGRTLLHYAARENNAALVGFLLQKRLVSATETDKEGRIALDYARTAGATEAEKLLR